MPSVILRHRGPSDDLRQALLALGETFERTSSPGDPGRPRSGPRMEDFGFNLCLVSDDDISRAEAITEGIEQLEELAEISQPPAFRSVAASWISAFSRRRTPL